MAKKTFLKKQKSSALSWAIFIGTLEIVLISLVAVIFPALLVRSASSLELALVDGWEVGVWAVPFVLTNLIMLGIGIAYFKNKLPLKITRAIQFIFNFEVSKKVAFIVIVVILSIYIFFSIPELDEEEGFADFTLVERLLDEWEIGDVHCGMRTGLQNTAPEFRVGMRHTGYASRC